ncbi:MAG: copper chaperone PCu(A)C [Nitrosomonadales bacterium]|nr:copper chaperone PCu(A)C [Nitrosomonadales bacterium]
MWRKILCVTSFVLAGSAWAGDDVLVDKVWLRESVPGQTTASLQLNLTALKPARLVGVSTPLAASVEIQKLVLSRGKIKSHAVASVRLPRNSTVAFGERNVSLMLLGLKAPLSVGERLPVSLTIVFDRQRARIVEVQAEVKALELSYKHYKNNEVHDHR